MAMEMVDQREKKKSWLSRSIDELCGIAERLEKKELIVFKERIGFGQYLVKIFLQHPIAYKNEKPAYVISGVTRRDLFETEDFPIKTIPITL